jgi:hypothetical protein
MWIELSRDFASQASLPTIDLSEQLGRRLAANGLEGAMLGRVLAYVVVAALAVVIFGLAR